MQKKERTETIVSHGIRSLAIIQGVRSGLVDACEFYMDSSQNILYGSLREALRQAGYICRGLSFFRIVRGIPTSEKGWLTLILRDVEMLIIALNIVRNPILGKQDIRAVLWEYRLKVKGIAQTLRELLILFQKEEVSEISTFRSLHPRCCILGTLKRSDAILDPQRMFESLCSFSGEKQDVANQDVLENIL